MIRNLLLDNLSEKEAKRMEKKEEQYINQAEYVPHPTKDGEYALFLHETYHLLSEDDETQTTE